LAGTALCMISGFGVAPLLGAGDAGSALHFLVMELGITGLVFAPMGAMLSRLFPVEMRHAGTAATYILGGILGAAFLPYAAQLLLIHGGLPWVGFYVSAAGLVSFLAALVTRDTPRRPILASQKEASMPLPR
jgi:hypothetical protein